MKYRDGILSYIFFVAKIFLRIAAVSYLVKVRMTQETSLFSGIEFSNSQF
jgi:hypothetical protein